MFRHSSLLVGDRDTCNGRSILLTHLIPAIAAVTQSLILARGRGFLYAVIYLIISGVGKTPLNPFEIASLWLEKEEKIPGGIYVDLMLKPFLLWVVCCPVYSASCFGVST